MKLGVSRRSNAIANGVLCSMCCGALSCWKMKKLLDIPQIAGNIFSINRTFLQYLPLTFTPGSTKHQCSLACAPNVVVRCRADDPHWPFFESFAAVHRGHFYSNPSAGTTTVILQQY